MVVGSDTLCQVWLDPEHRSMDQGIGHLVLMLQQMMTMRRGCQKGGRRHGLVPDQGSSGMIYAGRGRRPLAADVQLGELDWIHFPGHFGREGYVQLTPIS